MANAICDKVEKIPPLFFRIFCSVSKFLSCYHVHWHFKFFILSLRSWSSLASYKFTCIHKFIGKFSKHTFRSRWGSPILVVNKHINIHTRYTNRRQGSSGSWKIHPRMTINGLIAFLFSQFWNLNCSIRKNRAPPSLIGTS